MVLCSYRRKYSRHSKSRIEDKNFLNNEQWLKGPNFLYNIEDKWIKAPTTEIENTNIEIIDNKIIMMINENKENPLEVLLQSTYNWYKLTKRVAYWLRVKQF